MSIARTPITLAALAAGLLAASQAQAATCGIIGSATATAATYDPFNPAGLPATQVTLQLQRVNGAGGEKTDIVNFYLKSNSTQADGTSIIPTSVVVEGNTAGIGYDIFYDYNQVPPVVAPTSVNPSAVNKFFKIEFTGNNAASDYATVNFTVALPANLDLNASTTLPFDAVFACSTTGGGGKTQQTGQITNAVSFPITVLSALQATYAGTALDFGEIGDVTTTQVTNAPLTYVTGANNYVRVQSSGPYQVQLTSQNNYVLTPGGSGTVNPVQRIQYRVKFLEEVRSPSNTAAIQQICPRAGVGNAAEDHLFVQAQLIEGGNGKTTAANYLDTLTITIAPQVAGTPPTTIDECNTLNDPF